MATINNRELIDKIIANNGYYEDDEQVYMIVEYTNARGGKAYGATWRTDPNRTKYTFDSEFIINPVILWCADNIE